MFTLISLTIKILLALFVILFVAGVFLEFRAEKSGFEEKFRKGRLPDSLPDGFYNGYSYLKTGPWIGKRFDRSAGSGVNIFQYGRDQVEKYRFRMYAGQSIGNQALGVIKIDYNVPENPLWLRPAIDELVETEPGKFLGKIHYRYAEDKSFVLGYFWHER